MVGEVRYASRNWKGETIQRQDEDRICKIKSYIKYYGKNSKMENAIAAEKETIEHLIIQCKRNEKERIRTKIDGKGINVNV